MDSLDELARHERRRALLRSALRIGAVVTALMALYALVPVTPAQDVGSLVGLMIGLVAFTVLVLVQLRWIVRADHPTLRATEAVAFVVPAFIVIFALTHLGVSASEPGHYSEPLDRVDALYFTVTTAATVGFGDITATDRASRLLVTLQIVLGLVLLGGLVRLYGLAAGAARRRRQATPEP